MNTWIRTGVVALLAMAGSLAAWAAEPTQLERDAEEAIGLLKRSDPAIEKLFETSHGYAVFPAVGKGAVGIGFAAGRGLVYEQGQPIGWVSLTQVTAGPQLGGQKYAEVIFFETEGALADFTAGRLTLSAQASAVAAAEGASANAKYHHGVLIYTMAQNGLMFEASVGGQKFTFTPSISR